MSEALRLCAECRRLLASARGDVAKGGASLGLRAARSVG